MSSAFQAAQARLRDTGWVQFAPSNAGYTLLRVLLGVLIVAGLGVPAAGLIAGAMPLPAAIAALPLAAALSALFVVLTRSARSDSAACVIAPEGVTVAGVGPVPWAHLLPPQTQWQPASFDSDYRPTPVLPFTAEGDAYARRALGPDQLRRLSSGSRLPSLRPLPYPLVLRVPAGRGMSRQDVAALLGEAHAAFRGGAPGR